jgi:hypothetical protein
VVNSRGNLWIGLGERTAHMVRHRAILDYLATSSFCEREGTSIVANCLNAE